MSEAADVVTLYGKGAVEIHDEKRVYRPENGVFRLPQRLAARAVALGFSYAKPDDAPETPSSRGGPVGTVLRCDTCDITVAVDASVAMGEMCDNCTTGAFRLVFADDQTTPVNG